MTSNEAKQETEVRFAEWEAKKAAQLTREQQEESERLQRAGQEQQERVGRIPQGVTNLPHRFLAGRMRSVSPYSDNPPASLGSHFP